MLKSCRICNLEFNACNGLSGAIPGMENWRSFCCSIACAQEYYNKIMESRAESAKPVQIMVDDSIAPNKELVAEEEQDESGIDDTSEEEKTMPYGRRRK